MTSFSPKDKKELHDRFIVLRQVCLPSMGLLTPSFTFKRKKDFDGGDFLDLGYPVEPSELKNMRRDRENLREHGADYISPKGKKWFFNTGKICGDFYSIDGNKKVEIEFPFWMGAFELWKDPETLGAVEKVLEKCSGHTFPTQKQASDCFSKKLLRKIHDKNPSRPAIESAVLEMMETLRQKISEYLTKYHLNDIMKEPGFLAFDKNTIFHFKPTTDIIRRNTHKVNEYLAQNKQAMYFLAQKFGLIKNAACLIHYEEMRDHPRHRKKVKPLPIDTHKILHDFEKVLGITSNGSSRAKTFKIFSENEDIDQHLDDMDSIKEMMDFHVIPKLRKKYKKETYYQDLVQKGFLTSDEADIIKQKIKDCNNVAHLNYDRKNARKKVMNDNQLLGLYLELKERHDKLVQRWIRESSHTF